MDRRKRRKLGNIILIILAFAAVLFFLVALRMYLEDVEAKAKEIMESTDTTYVSKNHDLNYNGLYVANIKDDVLKFIEEREISTITYKFEGEPFYLELAIDEDKEGNKGISITKIVNENLGVKARTNMKNIESIEYRTGNVNQATVLRINAQYSSDYFVMTEGTHYFLGSDVETVSNKDGQFYYMSYNKNYLYLEEAKSCSKEVKAEIDGFNKKDHYYKYGKINFLDDYYQKLSSKVYTVGEKCKEFEKEKKE